MDHRIDVLNPDGTVQIANIPLTDALEPAAGLEEARVDIAAGREHVIGGGAAPLFILRPVRPDWPAEDYRGADQSAQPAVNDWWAA